MESSSVGLLMRAKKLVELAAVIYAAVLTEFEHVKDRKARTTIDALARVRSLEFQLRGLEAELSRALEALTNDPTKQLSKGCSLSVGRRASLRRASQRDEGPTSSNDRTSTGGSTPKSSSRREPAPLLPYQRIEGLAPESQRQRWSTCGRRVHHVAAPLPTVIAPILRSLQRNLASGKNCLPPPSRTTSAAVGRASWSRFKTDNTARGSACSQSVDWLRSACRSLLTLSSRSLTWST